MKRLALPILSAAAVAVGTAGIAAPSASALVNTCSGPAATGCTTLFDGYRTYIESWSSKTGGNASSICAYFSTASGTVAGGCASNATVTRQCYGLGLGVYGRHWGSSDAWTVDGRDATASDRVYC